MRVLDQYEIESTSTYESGSYDQVVMGRMLTLRKKSSNEFSYTPAKRGVVFGSVNSSQIKNPGNGLYDFSTSLSYRLQPYKERAGNCRAAKHYCYSEQYYDSMPPDIWSCFKINGAHVFICGDWYETPGYGDAKNGLRHPGNGFVIFDNYVTNGSPGRERLNAGVDKHWTKSFPYEPRYFNVKRQKNLKFLLNSYATYRLNFLDDSAANAQAIPAKKVDGVFFGIVGPEKIGSYYHDTGSISAGQNWYHHWACNVFTTATPGGFSVTGTVDFNDAAKVLYGFGDVNSVFYTSSYGNDRLGTHNWPDFRVKFNTENLQIPDTPPLPPFPIPENYEFVTGSKWQVSPVIRGWKYGLHSALPSYTSAYYRQGRYGQFRDMLEQRQYTKLFVNPENSEHDGITADRPKNLSNSAYIAESAVVVQFLDSNGNITQPTNTQSSNLSYEATSSLPYFDLQFRNVSAGQRVTNLAIVSYNINGSVIEM